MTSPRFIFCFMIVRDFFVYLPPCSIFPFLFTPPSVRFFFRSMSVAFFILTILDFWVLMFSWAIHSNLLFAVGHTFQPFVCRGPYNLTFFSFSKLHDAVSSIARVRATLSCPPSLRAQAPVIAGLRARPRNCGPDPLIARY